MGYFPISLEMEGCGCVMIGGGVIAERKVHALLEAGATVTVISPSLTERLQSWATEGQIRHLGRDYQRGDLAGFRLGFSATDDRKVNAAVYEEGRALGVWVNTADDPEHCDFILPAVLRRGPLVVAITTGGTSPALSRAIREELEDYFSDDYATLARVVADIRGELRQNSRLPSPEAWHKALDAEFRKLLRERGEKEARDYLLRKLGV